MAAAAVYNAYPAVIVVVYINCSSRVATPQRLRCPDGSPAAHPDRGALPCQLQLHLLACSFGWWLMAGASLF
jgi:hypothetical protein